MDENDIYKNIKDLEYQHLLNMQNIVLGFIGAAIITALFLPQLPETWPAKENVIFLLIFIGVFFFFYFRKELENRLDAIRAIKLIEPKESNKIITKEIKALSPISKTTGF